MKEYRKWRAKERQHLIDIAADCSRTDSEAAWRTALEQVLAKIDFCESDAKNIIAVFNFIEEELGKQ